LGINHLFVRRRNIKEVELMSGNAAVADRVFPHIRTSWSLEWAGKRCYLTKPQPVSTDPGIYNRISILIAGPWRRSVNINNHNDILDRTPSPCVGGTGRTKLFVGGYPSIRAIHGAVGAEEMQHASNQERMVCRQVHPYEAAVRTLPSSFLTEWFTDGEEEAE
jgi:hypothetical protein